MFVRHGLGMTETFSESRRGRQRWEAGSLNMATTLKQELANLEVQDQLRARTRKHNRFSTRCQAIR